MNMIKNLMAAFAKDESGAVTVDWVVLTAAVVGLGFVATNAVSGQLAGGVANLFP
jgi:Flp pilus assembly pilin Flp